MLKRIPLRDLRIGMFIHQMGGRWVDHPFWRSSFALTTDKDYRDLLGSAVPDVVIDTVKGLDVALLDESVQEPVVSVSEPDAKPVASVEAAPAKVSFEREVEQAKAIQSKAKVAVTSMFREARMGKAIEVASVAPLVDEINGSLERNVGALLSVVRLKTADDYTYMHSVAVCGLMIALGRTLGIDRDELHAIGLGGLLHDLGKIAMPIEVLNKPGKLTDEEFNIMRSHPGEGWKLLKKSNAVGEVPLDICLHHHERMDGKGYPQNLAGDALTLHARMGAVCDVYDAVTSDRPYKSGWAPAESLKRMAEWCNGHFDPVVFQAFVKTVGIYPAGSLVRLKSGRLAVVTDQGAASLLEPRVKVFYSLKAQEPISVQIIDLARSQDAIQGLEDTRPWQDTINRLFG